MGFSQHIIDSVQKTNRLLVNASRKAEFHSNFIRLIIDSQLSHHSDRFRFSVRLRLARGERRQIAIPRLVPQRRFALWHVFLHRQHPVPRITYRMEKRAPVHLADSVPARGIAQTRPGIVGYGAGRGNEGMGVGGAPA